MKNREVVRESFNPAMSATDVDRAEAQGTQRKKER